MNKTRFDTLIPLPAWGNLQLAATGVRALENFSDLVHRYSKPAPLNLAQRLDIAEDFLDLVVLRPDLPAGFEFTGITIAEFRAALLSGRHRAVAAPWLDALAGEAMLDLHEAARRRIAIRPKTVCIQHLSQWLPLRYADQPYVVTPEELQRLMVTAGVGWAFPKRSRFLVELANEAGSWKMRATTRGKRFRVSGGTGLAWFSWHRYRLLPRSEDGDFDGLLGDYQEYELTLPSLEASYFSNHFIARNTFAHFRVDTFWDTDGRPVMLLHEIQSDWLRDLHLQRQGKARPKTIFFDGQNPEERQWEPVPPCPVAGAWLELVLEAVIGVARRRGCKAIAWVPGSIQSELNPGLALSVRKLYDKELPRALAKLLNVPLAQRREFAYPTYQRNVMIDYRRKKGHFLTAPDRRTPISAYVPDEETVMSLFRAQAIPTVERLPAFDLDRAPGEYAQPDHAKVPFPQPQFEEEDALCSSEAEHMDKKLEVSWRDSFVTPSTALLNQLATLNAPRMLTPSEIALLRQSKQEIAARYRATRPSEWT